MTATTAPTGTSDFNPRPPCGGRPLPHSRCPVLQNFNPRPPCGGRQDSNLQPLDLQSFQSTPSVWRATFWFMPMTYVEPISIHALRVEGDLNLSRFIVRYRNFNPRPPCGGRLPGIGIPRRQMAFQSTPSVWRATQNRPTRPRSPQFQSTPSVWRATRWQHFDLRLCSISIHALRVEGDFMYFKSTIRPPPFQSTPSVWRATLRG